MRPSPCGRSSRERLRSHWGKERLLLVSVGIVCFYVVYVSYRNLKSYLPFVRSAPGDSSRALDYDRELHLLDRVLFFGNDPSDVLHTIFGTSRHGARPVLHLPVVPADGAADRHHVAGLVAQPVLRLLVRHVARHRLDAGHALLLPAAHTRTGLRVRLLLPGPRQHADHRPDEHPAGGQGRCSNRRARRRRAVGRRVRQPALRDHAAARAHDPVHPAVEDPANGSGGSTSVSRSSPPSTSAGTTSPTTSPAS